MKPPQIRIIETRTKCFRQNTIFKTDAKKFYREIGKQSIDIKKTPTMKEVEDFWKKISSKPKEKAEWITREEVRTKDTEQQEWKYIELKQVQYALKKSHKQQSAEIDKLTNSGLTP